MDILSPKPSSRALCEICSYPSWTEASGDGNDEFNSENMCSDFDKLQLSASNCLGCMVISKAWEYGTPVPEDRAHESITFNRCSGNLYVHLFKRPHGVLNIDVFTVAHMPRFKHIRVGALILLSTDLSDNLARVLQWLRACEKQHKVCGRPNDQVPPRLLDLETSSPDVIRLVQPEQLNMGSVDEERSQADFRYACLSHCWGKSRFKHMTKTSNLDDNFKGIYILNLPQTFQDAIAISRALGIRYLWIDSLCIVQDDLYDWKLHVDEMAQIYRNAYITIAAGASTGDDSGCFREALRPFVSPSSFKLQENVVHEIFLRKHLPHPDEEWPMGEVMPLMERGWVFQERLLSRRFLCFAANEVLWECLEDVACSCSTTPEGFKDHDKSGKPMFLNCPPSKFEFARIGELPQEKLWKLWRDLVMQYTRRDLTFATDKLPALAGLARSFQSANAGEYVHGVWTDCIKQDMLWQNRGYNDYNRRPRKAPSWSWVSAADGGIEWEEKLCGSPTEVIRLVDDPRNFYHVIEDNFKLLLIRGPLANISLHEEEITNGMEAYKGFRRCSVNKWSVPSLDLGTAFESIPTTTLGNAIQPSHKKVLLPMTCSSGNDATGVEQYYGEIWSDYKFWSDEKDLWHSLNDIFFLDLGIENFFVVYDGVTTDTCHVAGLILKTSDRAVDGTPVYERISWLRFRTGISSKNWKPVGDVTQILIE